MGRGSPKQVPKNLLALRDTQLGFVWKTLAKGYGCF